MKMYAAKTNHEHIPEWKQQDQARKQQVKNEYIEKIVNELIDIYKADPKTKLQFTTKHFLKTLGKTPLANIGDTENYRELMKFLMTQMRKATDENPAENILHPLEIKLVILENPQMLMKCDNLSDDLQRFACDLSFKNIQYIRRPLPSLVSGFLNKFPFEIDKIPAECVPPEKIINAILKGQLPIQKFDKMAFLKSLQQNGLKGLTADQLVTFINKNRELFTDNDFKFICKIAVAKKDKRLFNSTFALVTQPDEDLTKSMLMFAPDQVCKIENPDARTQKLALKSAYESHVSLSNVYNKIPEPFPDVTEYYQLLSLYENRLDRWYLDEIYESFKHPSEKVTEKYKLYKLDCLYRYGDYWGFVGFSSPNLSRKLQEKFQKLFLIAAHESFPQKTKRCLQRGQRLSDVGQNKLFICDFNGHKFTFGISRTV